MGTLRNSCKRCRKSKQHDDAAYYGSEDAGDGNSDDGAGDLDCYDIYDVGGGARPRFGNILDKVIPYLPMGPASNLLVVEYKLQQLAKLLTEAYTPPLVRVAGAGGWVETGGSGAVVRCRRTRSVFTDTSSSRAPYMISAYIPCLFRHLRAP